MSEYKRIGTDPPYVKAGFLSLISVCWLTKLLNKICRGEFKPEEDLWDCAPQDKSAENGEKLDQLWREEVRRKGAKRASFLGVLIRFGFRQFLIILIGNIGMATAIFLSTSVCVYSLLQYSSSNDRDLVFGLGLVAGLTAMMVMRVVCQSLLMNHGVFLGVRIRTATVSLLYKKVLRIRDIGPDTVGMLVNVLAADGQRIQRGVLFSLNIVCGPPVLIAGSVYAVIKVGPLSLLGSLVFALEILIIFNTAHLMGRLRRNAASITDKREYQNCVPKMMKPLSQRPTIAYKKNKSVKDLLVKTKLPPIKLISEILTSIKTIKIQAWEKSFAEAVLNIRKKERNILFKIRILQSLSTFASGYAMVFAQLLSIIALILVRTHVSAVEIFSLIAVLSSLKIAVELMPSSMKAIADLRVACQRIKVVLLLDEYNPPQELSNIDDIDKYCVKFNGASFAHVNYLDEVKKKGGNSKPTTPDEEEGKTECTEKTYDDDNTSAIKPKWTKSYGTLHGPNNQVNGSEIVRRKKYKKKECPEENIIPALNQLDFAIEKGRLIGICGAIGTGKSSLLLSILGRMRLLSGSFATHGHVAYVPQQAWVFNATLKDNIIFGYPFDEKRYQEILKVCCLVDDINLLPDGEQTEIGERGVNLSGGQKQRVSLARAVYSNRDVYLLDDPLSAVDNRVATALFNHCIKETLKGKSVLLVTHQVRFLSECDKVIFLMHSGIAANKTHAELLQSNPEYHDMIRSVSGEENNRNGRHNGGNGTPKVSDEKTESQVTEAGQKEKIKVSQSEEVAKGGLRMKTVWTYITAAGGCAAICGAVLTCVLFVCGQAFPVWWLTFWLHSSKREKITINTRYFDTYMTIYGCSGIGVVLFGVLSACVIATMTYKASNKLHTRVLRRVMTGKMSFFDVTPIGQIQNLFSSDMDQVDNFLSYHAEITVYYVVYAVIIIGTVTSSSPIALVAVVPVILMFWYIWSRSKPAIRDLKRLENAARSPLYSLITSTVHGLTAITTYNKNHQFAERFNKLLDRHHVRLLLSSSISRWTGTRLDSVSVILVCLTSLLIVLSPDEHSSAQAGLALTFALQFTGLLTIVSMFSNEFLSALTSVEGIDSYIENFPLELRCVKPYFSPDSSWPDKGEVLFRNFCLRYQKHLPNVLDSISVHVKPGDKVGVVGRTGAGKSSLMVALYRLVEGHSGGVFIDGVDITTLPIRQLRAKLSLIPQDPVLFEGTVRFNVDPFSSMEDEEIWSAIDKCNMREKISDLPGGLSGSVSEGGLNFSVGERQLICMARALLHKSKVMLLDEATASVDPQTDALIQRTIRTAFPDCTMLIIAHRLNTVLDCDKILLMEKGKVAEYDSPGNLLSNPDSLFKQLIDANDE